MNVVARHALETCYSIPIATPNGTLPPQAWDLLWCDVRSTPERD